MTVLWTASWTKPICPNLISYEQLVTVNKTSRPEEVIFCSYINGAHCSRIWSFLLSRIKKKLFQSVLHPFCVLMESYWSLTVSKSFTWQIAIFGSTALSAGWSGLITDHHWKFPKHRSNQKERRLKKQTLTINIPTQICLIMWQRQLYSASQRDFTILFSFNFSLCSLCEIIETYNI